MSKEEPHDKAQKNDNPAEAEDHDILALYNLRTLNSVKFIKVINKILGQTSQSQQIWVPNAAPRSGRSDPR